MVFFLGNPLSYGQTFNTLTKANEDFQNTNYYYALQDYLKVYDKKPDDADVLEKIVLCNRYLHNFNDELTWCDQLIRMDGNNTAYKLEHARAQHNLGKYVDAKSEYQDYIKLVPNDSKMVKELIRSCDSGLKWSRNPDPTVKVRNMTELNTPNSEFGLTKFGNGYLFASDRKIDDAKLNGSKKTDPPQEIFGFTGRPYLKLYYVNKKGDSSWEEPSFFSKLMTEKYHTSNASYDETNNILYFTRTRKIVVPKSFSKTTFQAELVYSEAFREIKPFPYNSSLTYSVGDPCITKNGKRLYFTSGAPGGQGGADLYYSDQAADGTWKTPINLGPKINTPGEERFPTLYNDSILYFSSDGHSGMGGLDIFTTTLLPDGSWSPVRNLGAPFNSPQDDYFLEISSIQKLPNGKTAIEGFFSSDRLGGKGSDDLYAFTTGSASKPIADKDLTKDNSPVLSAIPETKAQDPSQNPVRNPVQKPVQTSPVAVKKIQKATSPVNPPENSVPDTHPAQTLVNGAVQSGTVMAKGKIRDKETGKGIPDVNMAVREVNKTEVNNYQTDSSGAFAFPLKKTKTYQVKIKKKKFFTHTDTISVSDADSQPPLNMDVKIEPMVIDKPVRLDNINYAFNSWEITSRSSGILDGLVKILTDNPEIDVEIASHTDTRGDQDINKYVSQQRAQAVVRYLILKGVNPRRLSSKGYGKERPLVHCGLSSPCTEEDHLQNRRTEFKIVKISEQSSF